MAGILRHGALALIELDGEPEESPGGVLRWPVHWDDLEIHYSVGQPQHAHPYRLGISGARHRLTYHAVPADSTESLCGNPARPLPVLEWSMPFVPTASRACPECVRELDHHVRLACTSNCHSSPRPR
ncbi:hypothetical protein GCM10010486_87240 [Nonomuraea roseoviolacea subsp. carminata]